MRVNDKEGWKVVNLMKRDSELGIWGRRRSLKVALRSKANEPSLHPWPECHTEWEGAWPPPERATGSGNLAEIQVSARVRQ